MFGKILIANRGEIALRIARACRELAVPCVAVYSTADADSPVVRFADEAVHIGPAPAKQSYLDIPNLIGAAKRTGADAVHPGYGFLSEDPYFAEICAENDLRFIGPAPAVMARVADKAAVRGIMGEAGVAILRGTTEPVESLREAAELAEDIGYPLVVKAVSGGGGRGIEVAADRRELAGAYQRVRATARSVFGDSDVYLEKLLPDARHIEVQVCRDDFGNAVHLGERDCSVQRRHQKLIEETPSRLSPAARAGICRDALIGADALQLTGVATMEFLVDRAQAWTFLECNARIQVEHPVTEMVTGIDLVCEQIRVAAGEPLSFAQSDVVLDGVSVELRINAEDPSENFRPAGGLLTTLQLPGGPGVRIDSAALAGARLPPYYDSLVAKVVVWAPDRPTALRRADRALSELVVEGPGVVTTAGFLRQVLAERSFQANAHSTDLVDDLLADSAYRQESTA